MLKLSLVKSRLTVHKTDLEALGNEIVTEDETFSLSVPFLVENHGPTWVSRWMVKAVGPARIAGGALAPSLVDHVRPIGAVIERGNGVAHEIMPFDTATTSLNLTVPANFPASRSTYAVFATNGEAASWYELALTVHVRNPRTHVDVSAELRPAKLGEAIVVQAKPVG